MRAIQGYAEAGNARRQVALIFAVLGVFTLTGLPASSVTAVIVGVAAAHMAMAVAAWWVPRPRLSTAGLGLTAIVLLSLTTWALDGYGAGLGPLFVLVFAWLGLHQPWHVIRAAIPLAAAGYAAAMVAADAPARLVASTLVLIPIAATVALLIRRTVRQLRETQAALEAKDQWRAALMATVAHDVRSPLTSVMGALEILEDDPETVSRYRPILSSASRQTSRVLRLAMGILEVERVEQGKLHLVRRHIRVAEVADEVALLTESDQVVVDIPADFTVLADPERLEQVLYNLVKNALWHGKPPVVITASDRNGDSEIHVRDHGDGVPTADVGALFDTFSSSDQSPRSVGLGLWIVKLLVKSHGGTVRYEAADPGARFVVTLPKSAGA